MRFFYASKFALLYCYCAFCLGFLLKPHTGRNWRQSNFTGESFRIYRTHVRERGVRTHACPYPVSKKSDMYYVSLV